MPCFLQGGKGWWWLWWLETIVDGLRLCNLRTAGRCISLLSLWLKVKTGGTSSRLYSGHCPLSLSLISTSCISVYPAANSKVEQYCVSVPSCPAPVDQNVRLISTPSNTVDWTWSTLEMVPRDSFKTPSSELTIELKDGF